MFWNSKETVKSDTWTVIVVLWEIAPEVPETVAV